MKPGAGHFRALWGILGAKGLFECTFLFEGRVCIVPRDAPELYKIAPSLYIYFKVEAS